MFECLLTTQHEKGVVMSREVASSTSSEDLKEDAHCADTTGETSVAGEASMKNSVVQSESFKATVVPGVDEPIYVTVPGPNDILLGRGAPIINYEGNVRFRALVSSKKRAYVGSGRHQVKDSIAKSIIDEIARRKGRFLKRVEHTSTKVASTETSTCSAIGNSDDEKPNSDSDSKPNFTSNKLYQVAEYDVAIEKVKQALRDKDTIKHQIDITSDEKNGSSGLATNPLSGSQHQQFMNINNSSELPISDCGNPFNTVRSSGMVNEITGNMSNDFIRNQQLQILSMQVQNRLTSENLLELNQQRLQQEQNQRFISGLLNSTQQVSPLQLNNLGSFAPVQYSNDNSALNDLRIRQHAELMSMISTSIDRRTAASPLLPGTNVMNPNLSIEGFPLTNMAAAVRESEYQQLGSLLSGQANQTFNLAAALGLGHAVGTSRVDGLMPNYQPSALLPVPQHSGPAMQSDLVRFVGSATNMSSRVPIILGDTPQALGGLMSMKRNSSSEEKESSVSKSSSSSSLQSKESSLSSGAASRKKFRAI